MICTKKCTIYLFLVAFTLQTSSMTQDRGGVSFVREYRPKVITDNKNEVTKHWYKYPEMFLYEVLRYSKHDIIMHHKIYSAIETLRVVLSKFVVYRYCKNFNVVRIRPCDQVMEGLNT